MFEHCECFKWHPSLFFSAPLTIYPSLHLSLSRPLPLSPFPCPSVTALVHPHVYLCYKAEESGRLKMKTPNQSVVVCSFLSECVRVGGCVHVCYMHSSILFGYKLLFYIQGWNSSPLHRPLHSCFLNLPIPLISSPSFSHGQVAHLASQDRCQPLTKSDILI